MRTKIIIFGHGSQDPEWRSAFDQLTLEIRGALPEDCEVDAAFLQFTPPTLRETVKDAVDQGITNIYVIPIFLFSGRHVKSDIPALIDSIRREHPDLHIEVERPIGERPAFRQLMTELAVANVKQKI